MQTPKTFSSKVLCISLLVLHNVICLQCDWLGWIKKNAYLLLSNCINLCFGKCISQDTDFIHHMIGKILHFVFRSYFYTRYFMCHITLVLYIWTFFSDTMPCQSNPCLNGGTCNKNGKSFTCTCLSAYTGTRCEDEGSQLPKLWYTHVYSPDLNKSGLENW